MCRHPPDSNLDLMKTELVFVTEISMFLRDVVDICVITML